MSFVFNLKDIFVQSIFVYGGNEKIKNGALNVVEFFIF